MGSKQYLKNSNHSKKVSACDDLGTRHKYITAARTEHSVARRERKGTQTSRKGQQAASKGGRCCHMPPEGVYVQTLLIVNGSISVRDTQHSAATHMQHLCCPRTHIAKALCYALTWVVLFAMYFHDCEI